MVMSHVLQHLINQRIEHLNLLNEMFDTATFIFSEVEAMHIIRKEEFDLRDQFIQK
ncbi:hypothetical protein IKQ_01477 [Bacillus cereus VDM053]|nr:hypothetical protein IKQ_01477 [Bacillus cereus VDM053]